MGNLISLGGVAPPRPLSAYETTVRQFSERLVAIQRPLRVLDAVKWDDSVERAFFAANARALPPVTPEYYAARPLLFDPLRKRQELLALERDLHRRLGPTDPAS